MAARMYHDTHFDPEPGARRVRSAERRDTSLPAYLLRDGEPDLAVLLVDLSREGFQMVCGEKLLRGSYVWVRLPHIGERSAEIRWCHGDRFGCEFDRGLTSRQHLVILRDPTFAAPMAKSPGALARLARLFGMRG